MDNWLLCVVGGIILLGVVVGFAKGALRLAISLVATLLTMVVVFLVSPYVSTAITVMTPIDEMLKEQCLTTIESSVLEKMTSETELAEEQVRSMLESVEESKSHIKGTTILNEKISRQLQIQIIENSDFPSVFKELLLSNNNSEVYETLGVDTFVDYVSAYFAKLIIDIIAFVVTFIGVTLGVRGIVCALDFVAEIPILGSLNRIIGALLGGAVSLIIVDFLFIIITVLCIVSVGDSLMDMIKQSEFLSVLYEHNYIMQVATYFR